MPEGIALMLGLGRAEMARRPEHVLAARANPYYQPK